MNYFHNNKKEILQKNSRNIIFIDFGVCKTSFFCANFHKDKAKIIAQLHERYLGLRDIDQKILDFYIYEFGLKYKKFRAIFNTKQKLIQAIEKLRIDLCSKDEAEIFIKNFKESIDLQQKMTKFLFLRKIYFKLLII